jgi:hypothetical protein
MNRCHGQDAFSSGTVVPSQGLLEFESREQGDHRRVVATVACRRSRLYSQVVQRNCSKLSCIGRIGALSPIILRVQDPEITFSQKLAVLLPGAVLMGRSSLFPVFSGTRFLTRLIF